MGTTVKGMNLLRKQIAMDRFPFLILVVCSILCQPAVGQEGVRAPIPRGVPAEETPEEELSPVVVGNLDHKGWALWGPRGRHYFFGGLAVADYVHQGERRIVTMQQEEPTLLPRPDDKFLYYRELQSGHRWAVGREPLASGSYVIYFQPYRAAAAPAPFSAAQKTWKEFQRAKLEWKK